MQIQLPECNLGGAHVSEGLSLNIIRKVVKALLCETQSCEDFEEELRLFLPYLRPRIHYEFVCSKCTYIYCIPKCMRDNLLKLFESEVGNTPSHMKPVYHLISDHGFICSDSGVTWDARVVENEFNESFGGSCQRGWIKSVLSVLMLTAVFLMKTRWKC